MPSVGPAKPKVLTKHGGVVRGENCAVATVR